MKTAAVVSYSSYHNPFITKVVEELRKVVDEIVVVSYDHFFNGEKDNDLVNIDGVDRQLVLEYRDGNPARFYHNAGRLAGYKALTKEHDAVFFADSDEVIEGDKVKKWTKTVVQPDSDYKLAHLWYYRDTCYRARVPEEGAVLVSTKTLERKEMNWFGDREREDYSDNYNYMANLDNQVLGHHYSWAGTKEMLLRKVKSWGHNKDTDWEAIVEEEFSHEFNGHCPFKPYLFDKIEPYVGFTFEK